MRAQHLCVVTMAALLAATSARASVEISANPTKNMNCSGGVCSPTAKSAVLNTTDLANMLATGDVKVVTGSGATGIGVISALIWTSANKLTLSAECNIHIRAQITVAGRGGLIFVHVPTLNNLSCPDETLDQIDSRFYDHVQFFPEGRVAFSDLASSLIIDGKQYTLFKSIVDLKKASNATPSGFFALADDYDATSDGVYSRSPIETFHGTLEGLGNTISNLSITSARESVGLIGENRGQLRDVKLANADAVGNRADANVGTLVGVSDYGSIYNCSASGTASNASGGNTGGLVGYTYTNWIIRSRANVSVESAVAGGLVGSADSFSNISQSFATGPVSGSADAGGLIGSNGNFAATKDTYATGLVNSNSNAGGLTGVEGSSTTESSYATGVVQSAQNAGGVFGYIISETAGVNYWDVDTSGMRQGCGEIDFADCSNVVGLTDQEMKSGLPKGFTPKIWAQNPNINNGYPYLIANPPPQ